MLKKACLSYEVFGSVEAQYVSNSFQIELITIENIYTLVAVIYDNWLFSH